MGQSYGTCRRCGRRILWVVTTNGKRMPCDPEVIRFDRAELFGPDERPESFLTPEGKIHRGIRVNEGKEMGYVPHFATCDRG